jgi:hypothetical protein
LHVLGTPPALILSQDQTLMLNSLPRSLPAACAAIRLRGQLFNARPNWLCVVQSVLSIRGRRRMPSHGLKIRSPDSATPRADTQSPLTLAFGSRSCLRCRPSLSLRNARRIRRVVCACTHYPVFKEPTNGAPWAPHPATVAFEPALASPSHRSGLAGKARRMAVCGVFRGTLLGY